MKVISLYSGAGGLDFGFLKAGFSIEWANDSDFNACASYSKNIGSHIRCGDIASFLPELELIDDIALLIGGPPCQGFSVAGKMNPKDPRSNHVWNFVEILELVKPRAFLMENVKALGKLKKWEPIRKDLLRSFRNLGYITNYVVLNASEFNVPQARERVFFIGFKGNSKIVPDLEQMLAPYKVSAPILREVLLTLDKAGTGNNSGLCKAKITLTPNPVMRKSPFAGMLFNGLGRPVKLDGYCATLPASMGGNKTPIVDEDELYCGVEGWVQNYHKRLLTGEKPMEYQEAPKRLRRLTVQEAALIQTFPRDYDFQGSQSSVFKQIGNAVPCELSYNIARMIKDCLQKPHMSRFVIQKACQLELVI